jgi:hypothetical protein
MQPSKVWLLIMSSATSWLPSSMRSRLLLPVKFKTDFAIALEDGTPIVPALRRAYAMILLLLAELTDDIDPIAP